MDASSAATRAFGSNVTAGNLIVVMAGKDTGAAFVAGDCTKSAGTATLGTIALDAQFRFDLGGSAFHSVGIWSAIVTGSGSCTMRVAGAAGNYWHISTSEWNSDVGWDASRVEQAPTGQGDATNDIGTATTGNGTSAGKALFMAVMCSDGSGVETITPDAAFTQIFEQEDASAHLMGNHQYRIVASGTTDAGDWTLSGAGGNNGVLAQLVIYKETAGGGGGSFNAVPQMTDYRRRIMRIG